MHTQTRGFSRSRTFAEQVCVGTMRLRQAAAFTAKFNRRQITSPAAVAAAGERS